MPQMGLISRENHTCWGVPSVTNPVFDGLNDGSMSSVGASQTDSGGDTQFNRNPSSREQSAMRVGMSL